MTNSLVAQSQSSTTWYTGLGLVEDAADIRHGIQNHSWVDGSLGTVGGSLDVLAMVVDPLGSLASWGVAWLMEHVKPLKDALDWLAGNPDEIAAQAATWGNVAKFTASARTDYAEAIRSQTAEWLGASGDAYRNHASTHLTAMQTLSMAAEGMSYAVEGAGLLVALVRGIVRDLIAEFVGTLAVRLPQWLAEEGLTLGIATPVVIGQVAALVAKWANKIQHFIRALLNSLRRLHPMVDRLGQIFSRLGNPANKVPEPDPHHATPELEGTHGAGSGWHEGDPIPGPRTDGDLPTDAKMLSRYHNETDPNEPFPFRPFRTPVHYLTPDERESTRLFVDGEGRLRQAADGSVFDSSGSGTHWSGAGRSIFVMDGNGNLYATRQELGRIHHSSMLAGEPVVGAGEIEVRNGTLTAMTDKSGHYQPTAEMNDRVLRSLREQGLQTDPNFKVYGWDDAER